MSGKLSAKDQVLIEKLAMGVKMGQFETVLAKRALQRALVLEKSSRVDTARAERREDAKAFAERLASLIVEQGGPSVRAWFREGVGARVYFPGEAGFLSVSGDGSVSDILRGRQVFEERALYPQQRKAVRAARAKFRAERRRSIDEV